MLVKARTKSQLLHILPSLFWTFFFVIPYLYTRQYFPQTSHIYQDLGISLFSFVIYFCDFRLYKKNNEPLVTFDPYLQSGKCVILEKTLVPIVVSFTIVHYFLFGFPLAHFNDTALDVATLRKSFGKADGFIQIFFYFSNLINNFIAPLLSVYYFVVKKWIKFLTFSLWFFVYAISSTAKSPAISYLLVILTCIVIFKLSFRGIKALFLVVFTVLLVSNLVGIFAVSPSDGVKTFTKSSPFVAFGETPADVLRDKGYFLTTSPKEFTHYILYRTIYIPIEVSNRWYTYYSNEAIVSRDFFDVMTLNEIPKASNVVGVWAYYERFPKSYAKFLNANASIDAEAFSFGPVWAVLIFPLFYIYIRQTLSFTLNSQSFLLFNLGVSGIVIFGINIYQSGLLAIFFAQGFWLLSILKSLRTWKCLKPVGLLL